MSTPQINHFEAETACFHVIHDGTEIIQTFHGSGKTSSIYEILAAETWEDIITELENLSIAVDGLEVPQVEDES